MPGCQIEGGFPLPLWRQSCFSMWRFVFYYDKQGAILHVYPVNGFYALYQPQRQYWQSLKWHNEGLCSRACHWTRTSCFTSCRQLIQWAPQSSCCPGGRGDFLLWAFWKTSAGSQTRMAEHWQELFLFRYHCLLLGALGPATLLL